MRMRKDEATAIITKICKLFLENNDVENITKNMNDTQLGAYIANWVMHSPLVSDKEKELFNFSLKLGDFVFAKGENLND